MRNLFLIFVSAFVLASCSNSTTVQNPGTQTTTAPMSDSLYFVYSGARSGSLLVVSPTNGSSDSITTAKVILHRKDTTGIGLFLVRDTVPHSTHESSGLSLALQGITPLTTGQSFSSNSSQRYAAATIAFSAQQTGIPPLPEPSGFAPGPNVFESKDLAVTLTYATDDTTGVALVGTFSGTFTNVLGDTLRVTQGGFSFVK